MAFTKITGPGIHTLSNIMTHNVKSSGIITAVNGNLSGWLAVGSTASFGGDVSIGGTLTYDDVTNVESVGIITAKGGLHVGAGGTIIYALSENNGTIGINSSSPDTQFKLDAVGSGMFTKDGTFTSSDFNKGQFTVRNTTASQGAFLDFRAASSNGARGVIAKIGGFNTKTGSGYDGELTFSTRQNSDNTMVERLRINKDGHVGINSSSPSNTLVVQEPTDDNSSIQLFRASTGADIANITWRTNQGNQAQINYRGTSPAGMQFYTGGTGSSYLRAIIDTDGKVGIGTYTPLYELDISGDGAAFPSASGSTLLRLRDSSGTATLSIDAAAGSFSAIQFGDTAAASMGSILYNHLDDSMKFNTGGSGEKLFITSDGKVGIGTNVPNAYLDVRDSVGIVTTDPTVTFHHSNADVEGEVVRIGRTDIPTIRYHSIKATHGGAATANYINFNLHDGSTTTSQTEVLRIRGDAKVGIATAGGNGALDVFGSGRSYPTLNLRTEHYQIEGEAIRFGRSDITGTDIRYHSIISRHDATDTGNFLQFKVHDGGSSPFQSQATALTLLGTGRVGIGSTIPGAPLTVHGNNKILATFGNNGPFERLSIRNDETGYPAIGQESSHDTLDLRSFGSVQATIDSNNNSVDKYFRVMTNGNGDSGTELFRVADNNIIHLGGNFDSDKVGGQGVSGQDHNPILKLYNNGASHWLIQARSDHSSSGNGMFLRAGNSSSTYTLYATGYDEHNPHLIVRGDGNTGIGTSAPSQILNVFGVNVKPVIGDRTAHTPLYSSYDGQNNTSLEITSSGAGTNVAGLTLNNPTTAADTSYKTISFSCSGTSSSEKRACIIGSNHDEDGSSSLKGNFHVSTNNGSGLQQNLQINHDGHVRTPNQPYFHVQQSPEISNEDFNNTVRNFDTISVNNGSHLNNSTGVFTVPVDGFYFFSAGIWSANSDANNGNTFLTLILSESNGTGSIQFAGCNHHDQFGQLVIAAGYYCTAGKIVRLSYNGSIQASQPRNYFSGFLVG